MRIYILAILTIFLVGCAPKSGIDNYEVIYKFEDVNQSYEVKKEWYKLYHQNYLNSLVDRALSKNQDMLIASLNTMQAYARVGIIEADKFPTFIANYQIDTSRNLNTNNSSWQDRYGANLSASYEIDLFRKIEDSISALKWQTIATKFDKDSLELSIMNSVVSAYFKELFLNSSLRLLNENLNNYKKLYNLANLKFKNGKASLDSPLEAKKAILSLESKILSYQKDRLSNQEFLKNLLFMGKDENLNIPNILLEDVNLVGVDLEIPYYALTYRPDLNALIASINSSFYNYLTSKKAFYPSITIGSTLSSNEDDIKHSFDLIDLSANLRINLPFLNYKRLKGQLKVDELEFEKRVVNYQKKLLEITNELDRLNSEHKVITNELKNSENIAKNNYKLSNLYHKRYINGKYELKDYIESKNSYINSKISILEQKYMLINNEIAIYKTLSGKYENRQL
ncbi:outer membrane efflux protein, TolC family [Campylobacter blaseri]|uniref:TolC family protein n=1 Tax=Campylobacter blaseri TaxID=2042961 RepID=A0A2P8R2D4_9BACT|nr:TolC family protein [Campylobacter blaseri]PSM52652.1 hypothetical protein CQ405_02665 [Campylobacter blaseri]PSM54300.1 hypothetical protein CRN67_02665 [Campylobacter blaseri]QKF85951.1 outer membrane efflux protein, TolC family [Campylobacter blaseri]